MNRLIAYSLLAGLIMIGANLSAEALPFPDFKDAQADAVGEGASSQFVINNKQLSTEDKFTLLRDRTSELAYKKSQAEAVVDWLLDGVGRAVSAAPPRLVDSFPPDLNNSDIPEFLVKNLVNFNTLQRVKNDTVGAKPSTVLVLSVKVTPDEFRRLSDRDSIINFFINNEERIFFEVQK